MKRKRRPAPRQKSHSRYPSRAFEYKKKLHCLLSTPCRSSFTVEAALALTLVILACVVLMVPMLILNHQRNALLQMDANAKRMAKQKYVEYYLDKTDRLTLDPDRLGQGEAALNALALGHQIAQPGMEHIDLLRDSEISQEAIRYVANYDAVLPFSVLGLQHLSQQVVASRRAWIGADGNRWSDGPGEGTVDDPIVYVSTRDTDVFHTTFWKRAARTCAPCETNLAESTVPARPADRISRWKPCIIPWRPEAITPPRAAAPFQVTYRI